MIPTSPYAFSLPPEAQVIQRSRTITTYYAQLYRSRPDLYKWAGMAAFASFHIGKRLQLWDWDQAGPKPVGERGVEHMGLLEADFQVIRIINNTIFAELGRDLLAFSQMAFEDFRRQLVDSDRHALVVAAFDKLQDARVRLKQGEPASRVVEAIWEANSEILWHEQSVVVQPLFEDLSEIFSGAMSLVASFDYSVNHHNTRWVDRSRFLRFMLWNGGGLPLRRRLWPDVTELDQRWAWIRDDVLPRWRAVEERQTLMDSEIEFLADLEPRHLTL